ncbi:RNA-binding domain-containing protein [Clostridium coskatii]|uniref:Divergent AAA domain protein n=1 Tax=Clostridium coskatii TaxID=1705578 RepID=A0A162IYY9_9CLOT|nr:RNA-binding domain-containing protein [Clostridium coskatii]OAA85395.1 Divergent AAA domain protein [Clostridium coskatii]OBR91369.1 divergent AAA domain protein [Clostridium coskatii]
MNEKELLELIQDDENAELECKKSEKNLPNDLWKTYSAFANTNGGIILLGIEQKGYNFFVRGVQEVGKILRDFWSIINNINKISSNILRDSDAEVIEVDEKKVIKIFIPRAHRRQRPIYLGSNPIIGTYRRNYDGDYKCSEDEVKRMLADQSDFSQDEKILRNYTLEDINKESYERYRKRFSILKPTHPWINLDDKEFLLRIGGWGKDRENNVEGLTIAGLLMFGNEWEITKEVPEYFLDYREKSNSEDNTRWNDRVTSQDGTWSGNIFDFYFKIINKLTEDINIPFRLKGIVRKDDTSVHEAFREALANALIHADYYGKQGIVIEKYGNYFKFSNPGELRISVKQAIRGGISDPRNKNVFKMFSLIGIGERAGSGIENIYKVWNEQSWRKPEIIEKVQPDRTIMILRTISLLPEQSILVLKNTLGENLKSLSKDEVVALVAALEEGQITNTRLQILINKNSIEVNKILSSLIDKKLLKTEGQRRGTIYLLSNMFNHSSYLNENSINSEMNSINKELNSINNSDNSINNNEDIQKKLVNIAKKIENKKRVNLSLMEDIILELCEVKPMKLSELAKLLNRNGVGLRSNYLNKLVKQNKLKLLYPGQINHPKQAYVTDKSED